MDMKIYTTWSPSICKVQEVALLAKTTTFFTCSHWKEKTKPHASGLSRRMRIECCFGMGPRSVTSLVYSNKDYVSSLLKLMKVYVYRGFYVYHPLDNTDQLLISGLNVWNRALFCRHVFQIFGLL
jgi:hypothetical protein